MRTYFDSAQLREAERQAAWREATREVAYAGDGCPHGSSRFEGRLRSARLGRARLTEVYTTELASQRGRVVADARHEKLVVSLMLQGEWLLEQDGRTVVQRAGDLVLWDSSRPFAARSVGSLSSIVLGAPVPMVQARGHRETRLLTATLVPAGSPMARLAGDIVRNAAMLACDSDTLAASRLGASILDIACSAVELQQSAGDGAPHRRLTLRRAKEFMQVHLDDTRMDADQVARHLGVSPRTLSRLFAAEGTTVMRWLWQQRLEAGHRMLQSPGQRVADVAMACGFTSFAHFSHSFRKTYGMAPVTLVRRAASGGACP